MWFKKKKIKKEGILCAVQNHFSIIYFFYFLFFKIILRFSRDLNDSNEYTILSKNITIYSKIIICPHCYERSRSSLWPSFSEGHINADRFMIHPHTHLFAWWSSWKCRWWTCKVVCSWYRMQPFQHTNTHTYFIALQHMLVSANCINLDSFGL